MVKEAAVFLLLMAMTGTAAAQTSEPQRAEAPVGSPSESPSEEARRLFESARTAFADGRHAESLTLLNRSFELEPRRSTALNLARLHLAMGRPTQARAVTVRLLDGDLGALSSDERRRLDEMTPEIESQVAFFELHLTGALEASLRIDGVEAGTLVHGSGRQLETDPGPHQLEVEAAGARRQTQVELAPGQRLRIPFDFPTGVPVEPPQSAEIIPPEESDGASLTWLWVALGVVAVAAGTGVLVWALSGSSAPEPDPNGVVPIIMGLHIP